LRVVFDLVRARYGDLLRRRFEVALVASLLIHGIAIYKWFPHEPLQLTPGDNPEQDPGQRLALRIVPSRPATPQPPPAVMREAPPAPTPPPRPRAVIPRPIPRPTPPVIATPAPAPAIVAPPAAPAPPPVVVTPAPPAPPPVMASDLASYIEQRRRARGETGDAPANVDSDSARRGRAVAQNLASGLTCTCGEGPGPRGGAWP
jgi:hypothetical protein